MLILIFFFYSSFFLFLTQNEYKRGTSLWHKIPQILIKPRAINIVKIVKHLLLICSHYISIRSFPLARSRNAHDWIFETREDCYFTLLHRILLLWLNYYHSLCLKITQTYRHTYIKAAIISNSRNNFIPHHVIFKRTRILVILYMFQGRSIFEIACWSNT